MLVIEKQGLFDYTIGFDFDQPRGVNEAGYLKECARRTNVTEHFSMSARRIAPTCDICKHDAGSNDLGHRPACLRDRLFDDFEAMLGLPINVATRGVPPPAAIGAVPATAISCPTRTARLKPISGSRYDPEETRFCGMI
jgi:hypothetical protein